MKTIIALSCLGMFMITMMLAANKHVKAEEIKADHAHVEYVMTKAIYTIQIAKRELEKSSLLLDAYERENSYLRKRGIPCQIGDILIRNNKTYRCTTNNPYWQIDIR